MSSRVLGDLLVLIALGAGFDLVAMLIFPGHFPSVGLVLGIGAYAVLGMAWLAYRGLWSVWQMRRSREGFCRRCGYDLRGNRERCSECGTPFPPRPVFLRKDEAGAELVDSFDQQTLWRLEWPQVRRIAAWKEDCADGDRVCLGFQISENDDDLTCHEEHIGWAELNGILAARFGVEPSTWWNDVVHPPFQRNWRVLWQAPAEAITRGDRA